MCCVSWPVSLWGKSFFSQFFFLFSPLSSRGFFRQEKDEREEEGRQAGWQALGNRPNVLCNYFTQSLPQSHSRTLTHSSLTCSTPFLFLKNTHNHTQVWVIWVNNTTKAAFLLDLSSCPLVVCCCILSRVNLRPAGFERGRTQSRLFLSLFYMTWRSTL